MKADPRNWPLASRILAGLILGAAVGLSLPPEGSSLLADRAAEIAGLMGDLWLAALKMTILPLVFALIATIFIRSHGLTNGSLVARRTVIAVAFFYALATVTGAAFTWVLLGIAPVTSDLALALRSMGGDVSAIPLPFSQMVLGLVPTNIVAAMAGPTLLPVLVFALLFGAALTKVKDENHRLPLANGLKGLADVMFTLVGWVLAVAPVGIALLVVRTAHLHGTDVLVGLAHYVGLFVAVLLLLFLVINLVAIFIARIPTLTFIRAMLPTQAVAFGTQSSLACLPLILQSCDAIGLRKTTSEIGAPLAVTLMRMSAASAHVFITAYAAMVYGIPFGIGAMLIAGLVGSLLEVGSAGIPSTATFVALRAPVFALFGVPLEILALLLIVETISDVLRTVCNVTADVTAVALVERSIQSKMANAPPSAT